MAPELETLAGLVNDPNVGNWAVWRMDVIRDLQKSLYAEARRVRAELSSRDQ